MDDRTIVKTLKPAVQLTTQNNAPPVTVLPSLIRKSPWMPTNATPLGTFLLNAVEHYGAHFLIQQMTPADQQVYVVTVEVSTEFRRPAVITGESP